MLNKHEHILALDIGASTLKLAEFAPLKSGGVELVRYAVRPLGLDPANDADRTRYIVTTLREMMAEHGFKPGKALISVSGQSVFSRFVKLPPVDKEKVAQIVQYEAQQNVPFPINEVVWDYQLVGGAEGDVDVMLAAIKAEIIEELTDSVEFAGLSTDLVDVAPMAVYNAVRYNYEDLSGCSLIIDMGARSTDLIFIEEGRVFSRSIPVAGNTITQQVMKEFDLEFDDAEEMKKAHAYVAWGGAYESPQSEVSDKVSKCVRSVITRMHAEINRSINFYRSQQGGRKPELILLTGGSSIIPYTDVFFKEKLQVEVEYLNPFTNVAVADHINAEDIGRYAHTMSEVVGLALRKVLTCPIEINLMPPRILREKEFRRKQPMLLWALFGVALIMGVWAFYFAKMTSLRSEKLEQVEEAVKELKQVERKLTAPEQRIAALQQNLNVLEKLGHKRNVWLNILQEIEKALPAEGLWLTSISDDSGMERTAAPAVDPRMQRRVLPGQRNTPASVAEEAEDVVTSFEIAGLGYIDTIASAEPIRAFRDTLRASALFSDETEIQWQPAPGFEDVVREFRIKIVLENPVTL